MFQLIKKHLDNRAAMATVLAPIAMLVEVFMDLMQPRMLADVVDVGIASGDMAYVLRLGGKMVLIALIGFVGGAACSFLASYASVRMGKFLREGLFAHIQKLSFIDLDRLTTSSLITRMTNDITQIQNMFAMVIRGAVRAPLLAIGGMIMAIVTSRSLSVIFIVAIPVIIFATIVIIQKSFKVFVVTQKMLDQLNKIMRESILGIRVTKAFHLESNMTKKFEGANDDLREISIKAQQINMMLWPIVTLVMNLSVVAVLYFGGILVMHQELQVGKIMAFTNYLIQMLGSLMMIVHMVINFSRAKASGLRLKEIFDMSPSVREAVSAEAFEYGDIEFEDVSFSYVKDTEPALKNISFSIKKGEKVAIIGSTGSGKSSLIQLIPRLYDVSHGKITIGGRSITNLSLSSLREKIGIILQEQIIFSGTIEDNVRFGQDELSELEIMDALTSAQAMEFVANKEQGIASHVEQRGRNFSGGQKQRLSIARTLAKKPDILILDDATSALDLATEAKILDCLKASHVGKTIIIVAQRISTVMWADKVLVLHDGEMVGYGTHKTLMSDCELYRSIAVSQLGEEVLTNGRA